MMIAALRPLCIRRSMGDLHLKPGFPVELPDDDAVRLLAKKPDAVRRVSEPAGTPQTDASAPTPEGVKIEPAAPNARPVYWETGTGEILGPAVPEFLARDGESFWVSLTFEGQIRWINADRLRSRKAFEEQVKPNVVELVKDPR